MTIYNAHVRLPQFFKKMVQRYYTSPLDISCFYILAHTHSTSVIISLAVETTAFSYCIIFLMYTRKMNKTKKKKIVLLIRKILKCQQRNICVYRLWRYRRYYFFNLSLFYFIAIQKCIDIPYALWWYNNNNRVELGWRLLRKAPFCVCAENDWWEIKRQISIMGLVDGRFVYNYIIICYIWRNRAVCAFNDSYMYGISTCICQRFIKYWMHYLLRNMHIPASEKKKVNQSWLACVMTIIRSTFSRARQVYGSFVSHKRFNCPDQEPLAVLVVFQAFSHESVLLDGAAILSAE